MEILKALARDAKVLILDEPTSVLTPQETESLFRIMRSLAQSGRSILFITHKLKEVLAVADRITVMRLGRVVGTTTPQDAGEEELASMMVGRSVELVVQKAPAKPGRTVLELRGLTVADDRGLTDGGPRRPRGPRGRDRRPGRRPGQRPDRVRRGRRRTPARPRLGQSCSKART